MSQNIKLRKGFDINLAGKAEKKIANVPQPETFALKPTDFHGILRPKVLVEVGDNVKAGTPILMDGKNPDVKYVAPVSGEIADVVRGEKRKLLEIRILADKEIEYKEFKSVSVSELNNLTREELIEQMQGSGVWANMIQRPYGVVAHAEDIPKAIFVSAFDTHPLAADINFILKGDDKAFQGGINVLRKLTSGIVNVSINGKDESSQIFTHVDGVDLHRVSGPHPAGNVGVHIHHISPISKGEIVWTVSPYGVVQIGKLFLEGKYDASKTIAVAGSEVKEPQYYKTFIGANVGRFLNENLTNEHVRIISGNVLTGEKIARDGYLGFYDNLVSVAPEGDEYEFLGWMLPSRKKLSFHKTLGLLSFMNSKKTEYVIDTNTKGEPRAFVQTGEFEKVTPMDILPTYLIKAILADDFDEMEALGIYEVIEEDLALCEFIDVSKHHIQAIVRDGLELMQYS